jgi:hypothetical protein
MIVVLPICPKDADLAIKLLCWIRKLGKQPDFNALIVADCATGWDQVRKVMDIAGDVFRAVTVLTNETAVDGWVPGSNSLFKTAAQYCEAKGESFLWMEPDCTPLKVHWLSAIHKAYQTCGKAFMGSIVFHTTPGQPNPYFEGNAVYPANTWSRIKDRWSDKISWTLACTERVIDDSLNSILFQHFWGEQDLAPIFFESKSPNAPINTFTLSHVQTEAVLFHRCKDASLIRLLDRTLFPETAWTGKPPTFVQLGRFGDLILLLPAFKEWRDRTGVPTPVISTMDFGTVLEGVSYVQATLMNMNWHHDLKAVMSMSRAHNPNVIVTQLHGAGFSAEPDSLASFSLSMWQKTGLLDLYHELPLVFDLRNPVREKQLIESFVKPGKRLLLVCFDSYTSPFDFQNQVMQMIHSMGDRFQILRTSAVKAHRVFDLLGLMDIAVGMITIDTMTLHLAAASPMPYIAYTRSDGQSGSIPKGNCVLKIGYNQALDKLRDVAMVLDEWASK